MSVDRDNQQCEPSVIKMLTAKEYNLIRYACTAWTVICGIVEVFCTIRVFSGDVAFISALFAAVSVGLALVCMRLSKSSHVPTAITAFLIDAILSAIATAAVIVWTFAAVKITSADTLDKEWQKKKSAYTQSVIDAAARLDQAQAKYTACTQNAATGGFRDRSKIALGCRDLSVDPTAKIFQPTEEDPGPQKTATKAEVGHSWEDWLMGLGRAGTAAGFISILFLAIVGAIARIRGKVEMPVSNKTGKPVETSLPLSPLEEVSPSPPEEVKNEVETPEIKAPEVTREMGDRGSHPDSPMGAPESPKDVELVTRVVTQETSAAPEELVNPIACYEGTYAICNERYALRKRKGHGWDLRYRGKPPEGQKPDIGYLGDPEGRSLVEASPEHQEFLMAGILRKKGKGDRPALAKRAAG